MLSSIITRTMTTVASNRSLIAVCQMTCDNDLEKNWTTAKGFINRAKERGAKMIFFPECFDFVGRHKDEQISLAMPLDGPFIGRFREAAKESKLWISLGGFHNKDPSLCGHPLNTHVVISDKGETSGVYNKLHLFDLDIPGKVHLMESEFSCAGKEMVPPVETPIGNVALSICYDLRFPELALWNRQKGAHILTYPSGFTLTTGLAHWEALLRARAIETQCYVVAAAQTGAHNPKRSSYGHAIVVDPWGAIIAQCSEGESMAFAEIDSCYVQQIREMQPVFKHRRNDLYTLHVNEERIIDECRQKLCEWPCKGVQRVYSNTTSHHYASNEETRKCIVYHSDGSSLSFGPHPIDSSCIFAKSAHSFAFVNIKPVLNGHVLVSPIRKVERLTDMTDGETADLFILSKKIQEMLEKYHETASSTVCVQDGPCSGQTVKHVHVHILPRKPGDFGGSTDAVYKELSDHDKDESRKARSLSEMAQEASEYRKALV